MENSDQIPTISVVGRPNVGKSSLFNWFLGERIAVVLEESGTTRDRVEAIINIRKFRFKIVDTGGYLKSDKCEITSRVKDQINHAVEESQIVLMVTDAQDGLVPADFEIAEILRKSGKPIISVVNKSDNRKIAGNAVEFYALGFDEPVSISCLHRRGISELKKRIVDSSLPLYFHTEEKIKCLKIAVVGRPNVGKSSFVNSLLKKERVIVSDIPGTTRDSIDTNFTFEDNEYVLIDTAGIRHKRKIKQVVDVFSIMRSHKSIARADVVLLLIDAQDGLTKDDVGILDFIRETGRACIVLVNKWDLASNIEGVTMDVYEKELIETSPHLRMFQVAFISAKSGKNVDKTFSMVRAIVARMESRIPTPALNKVFSKSNPSRVPISKKKKKPNFLYIVQTSNKPMKFMYFVNDPQAVIPAHLSFIENKLRDNFPLKGLPVKIVFKSGKKKIRSS